MSRINNPHDKFTKSILSDKDVAEAFFRAYIPKDVQSVIDISTLEMASSSYITEELEEQYSDIVYKVKTKRDKECHVSILIEHKSYVDKNVSVQILGYIHKAMSERLKNKEALIPIIPILYYHGKEEWQVKSMRELMGDYGELILKYVPDFIQIFVDLQSQEEEEILKFQQQVLKAFLLLQKSIGTNYEKSILKIIFTSLDEVDSRNYLVQFFVYILSVSDKDDKNIIAEIKKLPSGIKSKLMTTYEQIIEKGIVKGIEQGIEQGDEARMIKTILKGYENGATIEFLSKQNEISEKKVITILKQHGSF